MTVTPFRTPKDVELGEEKTRERVLHYIEHPPENSRVFKISPAFAGELLRDFNKGNRPRKPRDIQRYADAMAADLWLLTGDTLKFSDAGKLRDGQNRLMACVRAGTPFRSHVIFGIADAAFDRLDQGRNRNGADVLAIAGFVQTTALAGAIRWAHLIESGRGDKRDTYSPPQLLRLLQERYEPVLPSFVNQGRAIYQVTTQPAGLVTALLYLFDRADSAKAAEFAGAWQSGKYGGKFKPIGLMQAKIARLHAQSSGRVHDVIRAALIIRAWNLFVAGKRGTALAMEYTTADPFPTIDAG